MTYGDKINEKVNLWKKADSKRMLTTKVSLRDALETDYRMQIFVLQEALEEIRQLKLEDRK